MNADPTISLAKGGGLAVYIPSSTGKGHHVYIPMTLAGLKVLRDILHERQREQRSTIGMNGSPTQEMVNAFLATQMLEKQAEAKKKIEALVPGLDLSTLNL